MTLERKTENVLDLLAKIENPTNYFHTHYKGYSLEQLESEDSFLYQKLKRKGLLKDIFNFEDNTCLKKTTRKKQKSKYGQDSLAYYHEHYEGKTISELPLQLANRLRKEGHSNQIHHKSKYGQDSLAYYHEHYEGKTISELPFQLVNKLKKEGHINKIPKKPLITQKYFPDVLTYYHEHYEGKTRGELKKINRGLLERIRQKGEIHNIPLKNFN